MSEVIDLRSKILGASDIGEEIVQVPEWDATLLVRGLDAFNRNLIVEKANDRETGKNSVNIMYGMLLVKTVFDPESGDRIFADGDAEKLLKKSALVVERVAKVAARLSGMSEEDIDKMGKDSSEDTPSSLENDDLRSI